MLKETEEETEEEVGGVVGVRGGLDADDPVNAFTYAIIGAAHKVHGTLGAGFTESTYHKALSRKLMLTGISFESQREFEVFYEGTLCGTYRPDMVVEGKVIVELKAVVDTIKEHRAQTISYLKASGLPVALLINFGSSSFLQVRRFEN